MNNIIAHIATYPFHALIDIASVFLIYATCMDYIYECICYQKYIQEVAA